MYRLTFSIFIAGCSLAFAQNSTKVTLPAGVSTVNAASSNASSRVRNLDGVAAIVNTGYITRKDIDDRVLEIDTLTNPPTITYYNRYVGYQVEPKFVSFV